MIICCTWIALSNVWIMSGPVSLARNTSLMTERSATVFYATSIVDPPDDPITPSLPGTIELATWCDIAIADFMTSSALWLFFCFRCRCASFLLSKISVMVASVAPVVVAFAACEEAVVWECAMAAL